MSAGCVWIYYERVGVIMKIGAVTIGQSPRTDVMADMKAILGEEVEVLEAGALDGISMEEIKQMEPAKGDYVLVSRLQNGWSIMGQK